MFWQMLGATLAGSFLFQQAGKKAEQKVTETQAAGQPDTNPVGSSGCKKSRLTDATSAYFHERFNELITGWYGDQLLSWHYAEDFGELKYQNEKNTIVIHLKNGTSEQLTVNTDVVWGRREDKSEQPVIKTPTKSWFEKNAGLIDAKVQKSRKAGYVSILYPVLKEDLYMIKDICSEMNQKTDYEVSITDDKKLKISFQNMLLDEDI